MVCVYSVLSLMLILYREVVIFKEMVGWDLFSIQEWTNLCVCNLSLFFVFSKNV